MWREVFAAWAPPRRPIAGLDLGSGTGRFTPLLAEALGGPVVGVEPSEKMRAVAEAGPTPPSVRYVAGRAEDIPLGDASCDFALMFLSFHHVRDRAAAAREIARVLAPDGRLLIRSTFADHMPELEWHRYFPGARGIEMKMFPTSREVIEVFAEVGFAPIALESVRETFSANLTEHAERLRLRSISTFEHMTPAEIDEGFARLDAAVEHDPGAPIVADSYFLVLARIQKVANAR